MKKIISLILAVAIATLCFASCGSTNNDSDSAKKETLVMATNAEFPPYEFKEGDKFVGIDVEIMTAIAEDMGMELKIEDMDFDAIIPAVNSGKADVGAAGMTVTEDRLTSVDFSDTYATARQVLIVKADSGLDSIEKIQGKKVGTQLGTTGDIYARDSIEKGGFGEENIEGYSKGYEAVQALSQGKVSAVLIDNEPAKVFVSQVEGLKILDEAFVEENYALCVKKGNTELLGKINKSLAKLKDSGKFDEIVAKYIKAE